MSNSIAVITTFPNNMWDVYAQKMITSFVKFWPKEINLLVQLDNDLLFRDVAKLVRPDDAVAYGFEDDHADFVKRNNGRDDPQNYRKQCVRFCHKVFAIKRALGAARKQKEAGGLDAPRYLIWMDADVVTIRAVSIEEIKKCLPKEGDAVAYLGRKDWDHSECGWLAFDLENGGGEYIDSVVEKYTTDKVFDMEQWHDSWVWDQCLPNNSTNLTEGKPGREIWEQSPMDVWSCHYKGPAAKAKLAATQQVKDQNSYQMGNVIINTKNALPDDMLHENIKENQRLIKNWIRPCKKTDEEIVVVSAGPMLFAEDLRAEQAAGKKIVAVKHAIEPLRKAGIKPWACILLDPRPHVLNFVNEADKDLIWFVASQVNPKVTRELLAQGCTIWGYHASVNANEYELTSKQIYSIVNGGSATATRGLYVLNHLGFKNFNLYGYDLCIPDKPDLNAIDDRGQPKYLEITLGINDPKCDVKKCFWTMPELMAQIEEMNNIIRNKIFNLKANGFGIIPFILKCQEVSDLRNREVLAKIIGENPPTCSELIYGTKPNSRPICTISRAKPTRKPNRAKSASGAGAGRKSASR